MKDKIQMVVVVGAIRNEDGKVLLQKRIDSLVSDADGKWEFPGGKVKFGETPENTLKRECREEAGIEIEIISLLPIVQSNIYDRTDGNEQQAIVFCYEAKIVGGRAKLTGDKKVSDVQWFRIGDMERLEMIRGIKEFIELLK